jgi:adenylate cyclase, class 2
MIQSEQEIEVKFFIRDLPAMITRLQALGAKMVSQRVLETNLRFDTPDSTITKARQALRLRKDTAAVLTFKGPSQSGDRVSIRQEIEFQVSDFESARHFLEALGYKVLVVYEKYRTTYQWNNQMITLDEMPFGNFIEIEGPDPDGIEAAAKALKLDWHERSSASYLALFYQFRAARGLSARNLTFEDLGAITALPREIGLSYADAER